MTTNHHNQRSHMPTNSADFMSPRDAAFAAERRALIKEARLNRAEDDFCEAGTQGCSTIHSLEDHGCETW
jgi:hypothetical protein